MAYNNYLIFCSQLIEVIQKYPNLRIREKDGFQIIKGILDIPNDVNEIVDNFSIEIAYREGFPFRFPVLYEVGGDIPNVADRHKYPNGACCITVNPDEILTCKSGITVLFFIETQVIPYFANQIHKKEFDSYKNGEYAHGDSGIKQFYSELFKTSDKDKWSEYLKIVFENGTILTSRNEKCFCRSNIKFKNCHNKIFQKMRLLGKSQIINDLAKIQ